MLELTIMGIALQGDGPSPSLLLHPCGTDKVIFLPLDPADAFTLSSALHGPIGPDAPRRALAARMLHHLGGRLAAVEIVGFDTGAPQAAAIIQAGSTTVRLLCRPAEGALLSFQCGAPLRAENAALAQARSLDDPGLDLSPHVRTLVRTAILRDKLGDTLADDASFDFSRIPLVLENTISRETPQAAPAPARKTGPTLSVSFRGSKPVVELAVEVKPVASVQLVPVESDTSPKQESGPGAPREPMQEEDRWAALLRVLAPETKIPM